MASLPFRLQNSAAIYSITSKLSSLKYLLNGWSVHNTSYFGASYPLQLRWSFYPNTLYLALTNFPYGQVQLVFLVIQPDLFVLNSSPLVFRPLCPYHSLGYSCLSSRFSILSLNGGFPWFNSWPYILHIPVSFVFAFTRRILIIT